MRTRGLLRVLACSLLAFSTLGLRPAESTDRNLHGESERHSDREHRHPDQEHRHHHGTVDQLLELDAKPFAIGHRGFGQNLGEDPSRPIENTVRAVRRGFKAGVSVVEVDVQLTREGKVAVFHDDVLLPDFVCVNSLTLPELQERLPFVPNLETVLHEAREFNRRSASLSGLVIVELKAAAPLCDPADTQEHAIVSAVTRVIRRLRMTDTVMLTSFSPALLFIAAQHAPDITRILAVSGLQFLTAAEVQDMLGLPVTLIDKRLALGLQWTEIGPFFRLPGYRSVGEVFSTAGITRVRVVEADLFFFSSAGAPFVDALHGFGLKALGFTATNAEEWFLLESLGLDGIYTDDVPFGVANQARILLDGVREPGDRVVGRAASHRPRRESLGARTGRERGHAPRSGDARVKPAR